jgi:hypothetical protein
LEIAVEHNENKTKKDLNNDFIPQFVPEQERPKYVDNTDNQ